MLSAKWQTRYLHIQHNVSALWSLIIPEQKQEQTQLSYIYDYCSTLQNDFYETRGNETELEKIMRPKMKISTAIKTLNKYEVIINV